MLDSLAVAMQYRVDVVRFFFETIAATIFWRGIARDITRFGRDVHI
jgi:hypothetical protein